MNSDLSNCVYHFNEHSKLWNCIPRDTYINYWNPEGKNVTWTSGKTIQEAQKKMLKIKK